MSNPEPWWPSRYGANDQLGTLNEITPAKIVQAARLVREGAVYDLGHVLHANVPRFEGRSWQQQLISSAHLINRRRPDSNGSGWGENAINWITELATGTYQIGTHLDGLNHLQIGDRLYNGYQLHNIAEEWGTNKLGIETVPPIITRGLLIDVARKRGVKRLQAGDVIGVAEIEAILHTNRVRIEPGDALLFHTGWGDLWDADPKLYTSGEPGIGMEAAAWLVAQRVAITGADTWSYGAVPGEDPAQPFIVPQTLNVKHGLFIMENLYTHKLAAANVYEFLFVLTHAKTRGSTAAGIAPAAMC